MVWTVKGTVEYIGDSYVVVDCNGIGYQIFGSPVTLSRIPSIGSSVKLFTYTHVKEDGIALYGFWTKEELDMFHLLITVSGIGVKVGIGILSYFSPDHIVTAVASEDTSTLSKCPGLGKKTAQRLILELKDKMKLQASFTTGDTSASIGSSDVSDAKKDALDALAALGYSRSEALKAVMESAMDGMTVEEMIKLALKKLNKS